MYTAHSFAASDKVMQKVDATRDPLKYRVHIERSSTLAVDGWAITFGTTKRELDGGPPRPLLAVPNVTAHLSTASVPITIVLHR